MDDPDIIAEILLRLPPDDPASLIRAAAVCRPWRDRIRDIAFAGRYRAFHRTPGLLGYFHTIEQRDGLDLDLVEPGIFFSVFVTSSATTWPPHPEFRNLLTLDSRHGRVLFYIADIIHDAEEDGNDDEAEEGGNDDEMDEDAVDNADHELDFADEYPEDDCDEMDFAAAEDPEEDDIDFAAAEDPEDDIDFAAAEDPEDDDIDFAAAEDPEDNGDVRMDFADDVVVWDPVNGGQRRLAWPEQRDRVWPWTATVLCAAAGCDHLDCHAGPFSIAYVLTSLVDGVTLAWLYSSHNQEWSDPATVAHPDAAVCRMKPSVLVGRELFFLCQHSYILELHMGAGEELALTVIDAPPPFAFEALELADTVLISVEDGGLAFAGVQGMEIRLWARMDGQWTPRAVIPLDQWPEVLPASTLSALPAPALIGFAVGVRVVFLSTSAGVFTIELEPPRRIRLVSQILTMPTAIPYLSFYTPDKRGLMTFDA